MLKSIFVLSMLSGLTAACSKSVPATEAVAETESAAAKALAEPSCATSQKPLNPDALPLAVEFLTRETKGLLIKDNQWLASSLLCPGRDGPVNQYSVILQYHLSTKAVSPERAEFEIAYQIAGEILPVNDSRGSRFAYVSQAEHKVVPLVLLHTPAGWRVQGPIAARGMFVLVQPALKIFGSQMQPKDRAALAELLR